MPEAWPLPITAVPEADQQLTRRRPPPLIDAAREAPRSRHWPLSEESPESRVDSDVSGPPERPSPLPSTILRQWKLSGSTWAGPKGGCVAALVFPPLAW